MKPIEIKNFLSIKECDKILEIASNFKLNSAKSTYFNQYTEHNQELFSFNKRLIAHINTEPFGNLQNNILNRINSLNIYKGLKYNKIKSFSFNKYSEGDYLNYHYDQAETNTGATITVILELSDDYEGGEFCYMIDNIEYVFEKGKGSLYIFDSNILHKVNKITKGYRYSINCWPTKFVDKKTLF